MRKVDRQRVVDSIYDNVVYVMCRFLRYDITTLSRAHLLGSIYALSYLEMEYVITSSLYVLTVIRDELRQHDRDNVSLSITQNYINDALISNKVFDQFKEV